MSNNCKNINLNDNNNVKSSNSIDNLMSFSNEFDKINILSNKIEDLFLLNQSLIKTKQMKNKYLINSKNYIIFNRIFEKEIERGNIEYKRSLESYNDNDKTNKFIRQIYWRIYEGVVSINKEYCYYIIGIEDSGVPSLLTKNELYNSISFVIESLKNTDICYSYLLVKNTILHYDYIIFKFWPCVNNLIDFF